MSRRLQWLLLVLILTPIAVLVLAGAWALVESGRVFWLGWSFPLCWGAAWLVSRRRLARPEPPPRLADGRPSYWTPRDRAAADLVDERIKAAAALPTERLVDPDLYLEATVELSNVIARHYHPKATDPFARARIVEIVAALNLVFEKLEQHVEEYVPGSHLLTVQQWRRRRTRWPNWSLPTRRPWTMAIIKSSWKACWAPAPPT